MGITLRDVNRDNWEAVIQLELPADQKNFVASNLYSLAESRIYPSMVPLAIYHEEESVGFCMYGRDDDDGNVWIYRLMIDGRHQRKGYGRAAMELLVTRLRALPDCRFVLISWEPENNAAGKLYEQLGFRLTGQVIEGEVVARLDF